MAQFETIDSTFDNLESICETIAEKKQAYESLKDEFVSMETEEIAASLQSSIDKSGTFARQQTKDWKDFFSSPMTFGYVVKTIKTWVRWTLRVFTKESLTPWKVVFSPFGSKKDFYLWKLTASWIKQVKKVWE